ncbi:uncharacterized protein PRCAT00005396001 [Priceomyces carsonii]|uniref:uncharacterized protein n=1 Tax=Priceomyces carsonii TaxID=28549 RepID=UPI002ED8FE47|nr:unnamed protein product [Priceomyces carsonii]
MAEAGLPPGWAIRVSNTYNREYFLNQATKESSWEPPFGSDNDKLKEYLARFKAQGNKPVIPADGKIRASHILIKHNQSRKPKSWKSPEGISRSRDEAIQNIKKLQTKILDGEAKLNDLAITESDDLSHSQGGDLGFFGKGQMQPSFEEAAFSLNVGEISDLVESDSGIHLIQRTA